MLVIEKLDEYSEGKLSPYIDLLLKAVHGESGFADDVRMSVAYRRPEDSLRFPVKIRLTVEDNGTTIDCGCVLIKQEGNPNG